MSRNTKKVKDNIWGYVFIAPLLIYFTVFLLMPMLIALYMSFTTEVGIYGDMQWVGWKNYVDVLTDRVTYPYFWKSLLVTVTYIGLTLVPSLALTLVVSALLCSKIRGERFFKTAFYIPSVTVGVAVTAMWIFMLNSNGGLINKLLGTNVSWLNEEPYTIIWLAIMSVWGGLGYNSLIMVSAMKNIDKSLYEAAQIDGAGAAIRFFKITLPSVTPTIFFLVVTGVIGGFQAFDQMYLMTGGGPNHSTYTYMLGVYAQAFTFQNKGVASAMSYILFVIILVITFIQFKVAQGDEEKKRFTLFRKRAKGGVA